MKLKLNILLVLLMFFGLQGIAQKDTTKVDHGKPSKDNLVVKPEVLPLDSEDVSIQEIRAEMETMSESDNNYLPKFVMPSPDSYSLTKYGDIPVNNYSGTPDISVPIWTIKAGDISVPISLSYHATGIKVDEIASLVGLGWSLNAGGVITRIIQNFPDSPSSSGTQLHGRRMDNIFKWYSDYHEGNSTYERNTNYLSMLEEMMGWANGIDNEPDIFYYNFNGKSGKFFFDNNGTPCLYKHDNIKIGWSKESDTPGQENIKFNITDEFGNTYEFKDREKTFYEGMGLEVTGWYLSKITSQKGSTITFSYQEYTIQNHLRLPKEYIVIVSSNSGSGNLVNTNDIVQDMGHTELKLTQITASDGSSASFIPDLQNPRLDYLSSYPTYPLKEIVIKNMGGVPERVFALNTSYFIASTQNTQYNHLNYRLKLDGITEYSGDKTQSITIRGFDYFGDDTSETELRLPHRLSPSQDHWGYFNGAVNTGLLPGKAAEIYIKPDAIYDWLIGSLGNYSGAIYNGADREPNAQRKKACVLKRINYPTMGNTEFDYESHRSNGSDVAGLRVLKIADKEGTLPPIVTNYSYSGQCLPVPFDTKSYFSYFTPDPDFEDCIYVHSVSNVLRGLFNFPSDASFPLTIPGKYVKVVANPQAVLNGAESDLGYTTVTVTKTGQGHTIYTYDDPARFPDYDSWGDGLADLFQVQLLSHDLSGCAIMPSTDFDISIMGGIYSTKDWPHLPVYSNAWKRSVLSLIEVYKEGDSTPVHKEVYDYYRENIGNIAGFKLGEFDKVLTNGAGDYNYKSYLVAKYYLPFNWIAPKFKHVIDYSTGGNVEQTTSYFYNNDAYRLLNKSVLHNSASESIETIYKYPSDLVSSVYDAMEGINMLNYPIEQTTKVNGKWINSRLTAFKTEDGNYVPDKVYSLETTTSLTSFTDYNGSSMDPNYGNTPETELLDYDANGNILKVKGKNGIYSYYLWAYNGQYPVAKIESSTNTTISVAVNDNSLSKNDELNSIQNDIIYLKGLLSGYINSPDNMVTLYTYKPLVGMTSQTTPDGRTVYFEYDNFGRLKLVRDHNNNILKKNEYHYAGQ